MGWSEYVPPVLPAKHSLKTKARDHEPGCPSPTAISTEQQTNLLKFPVTPEIATSKTDGERMRCNNILYLLRFRFVVIYFYSLSIQSLSEKMQLSMSFAINA